MKKLMIVILFVFITVPAVASNYTVADERAFIQSCMVGGATRVYCTCVFRWFRQNVSYRQFTAMGLRTHLGQMTDADAQLFRRAAFACQ